MSRAARGTRRRAAPRRGTARAWLCFLGDRPRTLLALGCWSLLQGGQTFLLGSCLARALDEGFLAGRTGAGLGWLGLAAAGVAAGALGTAGVQRAVGALAEPLRDALVREVVRRALDGAVREGRADGTAAVSRLTHQVEIARDSFAGLVLVAQGFLVTLAGALGGLAWLAPVLLPLVAAPLLLGLGLLLWSLGPLARHQRALLAADESLAGAWGEVAAGLRDIAACGAEERAAAEVGRHVERERRAAVALARWGVIRTLAPAVGGRGPLLALLFLGPWLLAHGVSPGELVGALTLVTQALLPALQSLVNGLGGAGARLTVVLTRLLDSPAPPRHRPPGPPPRGRAAPGPAAGGREAAPARRAEPPGGGAAPATGARAGARGRGALELRGVGFGYGGRAAPVLRGLDLVVPEGGHLAVVGPSGAGKSTLAALVAGLLRPDAGEVLLGGVPATGQPGAPPAARRVVIPQEAYVFSGSVAANLGYLCGPGTPGAALLAAAEAVGAAELVARLGGLAGRVEPAALSAGERQLLALARAYLSPAPLALLDEATCHLDPAAEARAERAFAARPGGTLLVVAHRPGSARRAARVLMLDGGRALHGRHADLLARSAGYRELMGLPPVPPAPPVEAPRPGSDPAAGAGYAYGVDAVAGAGLADDGGQVVAHRSLGEPQGPGDLGHGGAVGGE
ncbi:ATP-binding cassette domain-containing protein [Streptomyces hoynatensis]|uniref:ATP-binding cassette domain-containing protein n=1 Tax=Streptomyces hoynatensis TaxID=1141874 RepID=UPI0026BC739E